MPNDAYRQQTRECQIRFNRIEALEATLQRVQEALKKIQAFGDPHVYILEEALGDGTSHA